MGEMLPAKAGSPLKASEFTTFAVLHMHHAKAPLALGSPYGCTRSSHAPNRRSADASGDSVRTILRFGRDRESRGGAERFSAKLQDACSPRLRSPPGRRWDAAGASWFR